MLLHLYMNLNQDEGELRLDKSTWKLGTLRVSGRLALGLIRKELVTYCDGVYLINEAGKAVVRR